MFCHRETSQIKLTYCDETKFVFACYTHLCETYWRSATGGTFKIYNDDFCNFFIIAGTLFSIPLSVSNAGSLTVLNPTKRFECWFSYCFQSHLAFRMLTLLLFSIPLSVSNAGSLTVFNPTLRFKRWLFYCFQSHLAFRMLALLLFSIPLCVSNAGTRTVFNPT